MLFQFLDPVRTTHSMEPPYSKCSIGLEFFFSQLLCDGSINFVFVSCYFVILHVRSAYIIVPYLRGSPAL